MDHNVKVANKRLLKMEGFAIRVPIPAGRNQTKYNHKDHEEHKEHKEIPYKVLLELRALRGVYYRL